MAARTAARLAESLLAEDRLRREGFFHPEPIRAKWQEHLAGKRRWHYYLWDVLMFQTWPEAQRLDLSVQKHTLIPMAANA